MMSDEEEAKDRVSSHATTTHVLTATVGFLHG